jgi:hypothetical protein
LTSASARIPASRHSSTAAAPWRFESFLRSVPEDHAEVREPRHLRAQRAKQRDVLRGVRQMIVAADDVGDLHVRVVDAHAEVDSSGCPSTGPSAKSSSASGGNSTRPRIRSSTTIVLGRHPEAHDVPLAGGPRGGSLSAGSIARPAPE